MKELNNYIFEKLKINNDIDVQPGSIDEKDFEYKFTGLTLGDFFKWYTGEDFKNTNSGAVSEFIDNSTLLEIYYGTNGRQWWSDDIPKEDFKKIKNLIKEDIGKEIILYQKYVSINRSYDCTFKVSFLKTPLTVYSMNIYNGEYDKKYEL